ncbi:hypothetical protein FGADI_3765 [Fusarium gaditjirri]|uniref:BTB domain-containing protein n=1 Tax=Fusarium gaditjirri TaxID=282569 RepID=A0A8H4WZJ3_9HYPO|nr:hypothetical protein FGADI_3765 [Fusarium gaditjirri]
MKSISYDIDPKGDIELILVKPNKQNIVPENLHCPDDPQAQEFPNPPCLGRYQVLGELYANGENAPDVEVRMRVSSRHLTFASRTFRAMLEGPWKEGDSSLGPVRQISAKDWDAFALAIVMDSIHGRHDGIPTQITDGLLARIATIVEYYECREATHFNYQVWAHGKALPSELCNATLLWLHISWVFHDENRFRIAARLFLRFSKGMSHFETHELPVGGVLNFLDSKRRILINKVLEAIGFLHETLVIERGCPGRLDLDCTAIMLGVLVREMRNIACLDPPLNASFDGHSLNNMLSMVNSFYVPGSPYDEEYPCTIQGRLMPVLKEIEKAVDGVCLADLQS